MNVKAGLDRMSQVGVPDAGPGVKQPISLATIANSKEWEVLSDMMLIRADEMEKKMTNTLANASFKTDIGGALQAILQALAYANRIDILRDFVGTVDTSADSVGRL